MRVSTSDLDNYDIEYLTEETVFFGVNPLWRRDKYIFFFAFNRLRCEASTE